MMLSCWPVFGVRITGAGESPRPSHSLIQPILINVDKTNVMVLMASDGIACCILIQNKQLEHVNTFPYLGSLIAEDGQCTTVYGISYQVKPEQAIEASLQKIWKRHKFTTYRYFNEDTTTESASLVYSNGRLWKLDTQKEWRNTYWFDAFEMKGLRKVLPVSWIAKTSAHQQMRDSEREPFYDDKTPSTGCGSECVSRCTSVHTTWHLDTCRHSANLCPAFLVAVTYAQLVVVNWTSPCQSVHVQGTGVCLRRSYILELATWQSQER